MTNIEAQEDFGDKFLALLEGEGKDLTVADIINFTMNLLVALLSSSGIPIGSELLSALQELAAARKSLAAEAGGGS